MKHLKPLKNKQPLETFESFEIFKHLKLKFLTRMRMMHNLTYRVCRLHVEPDLDGAEGEGQSLDDVGLAGEAGPGGAEEGGGVEDVAATTFPGFGGLRGAVELAVDFAQ